MKNLSYLPEFLEEIKDIEFQIKPKLSKKDILLLDILLDEYNKNKKISNILKFSDLSKILNFDNKDEIFNVFSSLTHKKIEFKIFKSNNDIIEGSFSVINSLVKSNESVYICFSQEIFDILDKNGFFYKYHLKDLMKLNKINSIIFYKKIVLKLLMDKKIDISIKSLKEMFGIDLESYTRFFDFEKYVLNPIFEEIKFIKDIKIRYNKIKTGDNKTNKILGLRFELIEDSAKEKEENISKLISYIREDIQDFNLIYNILKKGIDEYGYEYLLNNIKFVKKNPKETFDTFLIKAIEKNYATTDYSEIYGGINLIYDEEKVFHNIADFQNAIYNYMISKNLYYSFNINFLNGIKTIKTKENIYFTDKIFKVIGTYNNEKISYIKIYKL